MTALTFAGLPLMFQFTWLGHPVLEPTLRVIDAPKPLPGREQYGSNIFGAGEEEKLSANEAKSKGDRRKRRFSSFQLYTYEGKQEIIKISQRISGCMEGS